MKLTLATVAVILAAGAVAAFLYMRGGRKVRHHPRPTPAKAPDEHAAAFASQRALLQAPEGATPCETGWNAIVAERAAAQANGVEPIFTKVAPKDEFLRLCSALPPAAQTCVPPRYATLHQAECKAIPLPEGALKGMFEVRPTKDPIEQENLRHLFGEPDAAAP